LNILIVGGGLIGKERLLALEKISKDYSLKFQTSVVDNDKIVLEEVKERFNVNVTTSLNDELNKEPDWVFICTPHSEAPNLTIQSFKHTKNIVVEKPLGRNLKECEKILKAKPKDVNLHVGLNYRFYLGINALLNHARKDLFGKIISVNMIIGHGNSPGMEDSWKLKPETSGGGALIDPGVHLLDLAILISNSKLNVKGGHSWKGFWNTGIEEEAHLILESDNNIIFNIQSSLNRWRSNFKLEINGTKGYGIVNGRGRSYGDQSYKTGRRWAWQSGEIQSKTETYHIENYSADDSFYEDMVALFKLPSWKISDSEIYPCDHKSGEEVMKLLEECRKELNINDSC
tara:strand:- start:257 stop:1288 length:1032 start_codon:yes stop_codon:yes gene_type:complete